MQIQLPHNLPLFKGKFFGDGFEVDFFGGVGRGEDDFLQFGILKKDDDEQVISVQATQVGELSAHGREAVEVGENQHQRAVTDLPSYIGVEQFKVAL